MGTTKNCLFILLATISFIATRMIDENRVVLSFEENEIIPDIISTAPKHMVYISYPSGVEVNLGEELTPTQVKDQPDVSWEAHYDRFYTLAMIDADVLSRQNPTGRSVQHWLVVNIPGDDLLLGETLSEYIGSGPAEGSGLHRYIFLVYEQPSRMEFDEPIIGNTSAEGRREFSMTGFAEKYNLGDPVAGNFYEAQFDDYVPILHAQLNIITE